MLGYFVPWLTSILQYCISLVDYYVSFVIDILDYYIPGWKLVILSPFVITFIILPTLVVLYLYLSALLLYVYRQRHAIYEGFYEHNLSLGYKKLIAALWSGHGWIWHGYTVDGLENLPRGPALVVYYHGAIPIDLYYLNAVIYLEQNRILCSVMDNFAFKIPGLAKFFQFWGCFPGPRNKVVELLKAGELVSIAPGGVREALFSENYSTVWERRQGFAKAALEAKVPVIPVFTENVREAFDYIKTGRRFFRKMYERTRWPILPLYGGFPVKLRTHIGRPIYTDKITTPTELVSKTKREIENLIRRYQRKPGSIILSFAERFTTKSMKELEIVPYEVSNDSSEESEHSVKSSIECEDGKFMCKRMRTHLAESGRVKGYSLVCQCPGCKAGTGPDKYNYADRVDSNENCLRI